jgi:hypothetical protein
MANQGDFEMKSHGKLAMSGETAVISELEHSQLAQITGGTIIVSDGYCVSPWRPPLPLPLVAMEVQKPGEFGAIAAGPR